MNSAVAGGNKRIVFLQFDLRLVDGLSANLHGGLVIIVAFAVPKQDHQRIVILDQLRKLVVFDANDGKSGVEFIVGERFATNLRVIGIRDRDYQIAPISDKIFYYDYGCMEMMIIRNDDVFKNLCAEYYRGEDSIQQLRIDILKELKYLSVIRMYNERETWGKKLKGVSISSAWNGIEKMDKEIILNKINQINDVFF